MENFEVTKREILFSVTILCAMVGLGVLISNRIMSDWSERQSDVFSATRIYGDSSKFDYIMRTDAGNFMADGRIEAANPVSLTEIDGKYMDIRKAGRSTGCTPRCTPRATGRVIRMSIQGITGHGT